MPGRRQGGELPPWTPRSRPRCADALDRQLHGWPYDDVESDDSLLDYAYRTSDPWSGDNRKLRHACETGAPLILFRKELANVYTPAMPVFVVEDRPEEGGFIVAFDESFTFLPDLRQMTTAQRAHAMRLAKQRLHQPAFRTRVRVAYETRSAICELRRAPLLDASHIVPDGHPLGAPTVNNGLALCKIHHAAYDLNIVGVTPDYEVRVATDVLEEIDGPMLRHGLREMHGRTLTLPRKRTDRPSRDLLAWRYERFGTAPREMIPPSDLLREHRHEVAAVIERHGGENPRIVGSVARGEDTPASDIDVVLAGVSSTP